MGYYASGYLTMKLKEPEIDPVEITSTYDAPKNTIFGKTIKQAEEGEGTMTPKEALCEFALDAGFTDVMYDTDGTLSGSFYDKYHEEDINELCDLLSGFIKDGWIEFRGEDDTFWMFEYCPETGKFEELNGEIVYKKPGKAYQDTFGPDADIRLVDKNGDRADFFRIRPDSVSIVRMKELIMLCEKSAHTLCSMLNDVCGVKCSEPVEIGGKYFRVKMDHMSGSGSPHGYYLVVTTP